MLLLGQMAKIKLFSSGLMSVLPVSRSSAFCRVSSTLDARSVFASSCLAFASSCLALAFSCLALASSCRVFSVSWRQRSVISLSARTLPRRKSRPLCWNAWVQCCWN